MPNLADLSTATKVLLGAGVLLLIDLFFAWQKVDLPDPIPDVTRSGWAGWGILVGLLTIALIVWEVIQLMDLLRTRNIDLPVAATLVSAALAAAILLFTIIKFLADGEERSWPAWLGLLLAIAIAVGGWLKYKETPETALATGGGRGTTSGDGGSASTTPGSTTTPGGTAPGGGTTTGGTTTGGTTTGGTPTGGTTTGGTTTPGGTTPGGTTGPGGTTTPPGGPGSTEPGGPPPAPPA